MASDHRQRDPLPTWGTLACPELRCLSCQRCIVGDVFDEVLERMAQDRGQGQNQGQSRGLGHVLDEVGLPARKARFECCRTRIICQNPIANRLYTEKIPEIVGADVRMHPEVTVTFKRSMRG